VIFKKSDNLPKTCVRVESVKKVWYTVEWKNGVTPEKRGKEIRNGTF
jgi:hypothetical protein